MSSTEFLRPSDDAIEKSISIGGTDETKMKNSTASTTSTDMDKTNGEISSTTDTISKSSNGSDATTKNASTTAEISNIDSLSTTTTSTDEFSWESYLTRIGSMAVETGAFRHVEHSQRRVVVGNDKKSDNDDDEVEKSPTTTILSTRTKEKEVRFKTAVDCIEIGRFVDVQDEREPQNVWPAEILENVGGRLLLKYLCLQDAGPPFWEFYRAEHLHPAGVCDTDLGRALELRYALPSVCSSPAFSLSDEFVKKVTDATKQHTLDSALFRDRPIPKPHQMEVGMWLEAVDPLGGSIFYPAVVIALINKYYFVIEHDTSMILDTSSSASGTSGGSDDEMIVRTCHSESHGLFPIGFAGQRGLSFAAAEGFDWATYLRTSAGKMAPEKCFQKWETDHRFVPGRRLEAVNPSAPHQICVATAIRRIQNLVWVHIDSSSYLTQTHVMSIRDTRLFPCGWCTAYGYPLKTPYEHNVKDFNMAQSTLVDSFPKYSPCKDLLWSPNAAESRAFMPEMWLPDSGSPWSPAIYVNARCFTGPHLDRQRLNAKPRQIGPGPMSGVLKTVAGNLISAGYRPRDILMDLQAPTVVSENSFMMVAEIKAKYLTKSWRGNIELCTTPDRIPEWCRQLCIRLEACPALLGFKPNAGDKCPFDCNRTSKAKRLGIAKPLSCVQAKRLKNRLAVQQKRFETAVDNDDDQPGQPSISSPAATASKRRRRSDQTSTSATPRRRRRPSSTTSRRPVSSNANRPVTRATNSMKRLHSGEMVEKKSRSHSTRNRLSGERESGSESGVDLQMEANSDSGSTNGRIVTRIDGDQCGDDCFDALNITSSVSIPATNGGCTCSINGDIDENDVDEYEEDDEDGDLHNGPCHLAPERRPSNGPRIVVDPNISIKIPEVESNPALWTAEQLNRWLRSTTVGSGIADQLLEELVDGHAFLLLNVRNLQDFLELKLGPALKVCAVIKELKNVWANKFSNISSSSTATKEECMHPPPPPQ